MVDLQINEDLEWGASNKLAYALLDPIRIDVQSKAPHLADLLESSMMYGGVSLNDLNSDEFELFCEGVSRAIDQRFERHTSATSRDEDGDWLDELLSRLQHIIRLAFILTMDQRYTVENPETLITKRKKLSLHMIASKCLLAHLNLGMKLLVLLKDKQPLTTLNDMEQKVLCQVITQVRQDQIESTGWPKYDLRIKHINEAIDGQLGEIAALISCD